MAKDNRNLIGKLLLLLSLMLITPIAYSKCTLKMVFKDGSKAPLMNAAPDNSGIFEDLYSEAATRIGCKLTITRLPKKRLHSALSRGEFDFYPAASFSNKRASYLSYIENGLQTGEYGISSKQLKTLKSWKELTQYPSVIWLMESNSSKNELADLYNINKQMVHYLNVEKVVNFIKSRPQLAYFYVVDKEVLDNYLAQNNVAELETNGLHFHPDCCGQLKPMYLAFARRSVHFSKSINEGYNEQQKLTVENQPTLPNKASIAYQFGEALQKMQVEGVTKQIYQSWYPNL